MASVGLLLTAALAAQPSGWRHDGSGAWPAERAPTTWAADAVAWRTPLPTWSNASPVAVGGLVCAAVEPTTLTCVDAATGALRWKAEHPIAATFEGAKRAEVEALVAKRTELEARIDVVRTEYSKLLREARRGGAEVTAKLEAQTAELDRLKAELEATPEYRTPPTQGMVGWSSPTPATDGTRVYALFANGVIAAHTLDGALVWQRWLGPMPDRMLGWDEGHAASPLVVGPTLVVPFRTLQGLDPATGATRWEGEAWPHYGAPAPAEVDGVPLVVSPSGTIYRARDGAVVAKGLADQWYVGPIVRDRWVWFLEARSDVIMKAEGGANLVAWTLDGLAGGTLATTKRWTTRIPERETFYAAPVVAGDHLHAASHDGRVWTLEAETGRITSQVVVEPLRPSVIWSSPAVAG
ncbi:MAG: PQQ-binding-like beta-propeller repeat protein, partial [Myxococcales bacterium]|nr:PQQ-binding-like beta-propeller repeat protein [Myxococcales bacterium]